MGVPAPRARTWIAEPWMWLVFFLYLAAGLVSFNRGLDLTDEGFHLYYSWMLALGQRIYKDFPIDIPPLCLMINGLLFKLFGTEIIVSRIYSLFLGSCGFFAIAYLSHKITAGKMALAGPAVYIFFSKNLFHFCMYNVDSKFFLLFSAAFALAWLDAHRPRSMFLAGLFAGMAAFSYQALLAVAGVELVLALLLRNKTASPGRVKPLALFGAGFALVGLGVLLYLAEMRVAEEFFQTMLSSGGRKGYIWDLMLTRVFPVYLLCVGLTLAAERLRTRAVPGKIAAALVLAASLSLLYFVTRRNPLLFPHLISMLTPVVLFTVSGYYLVAGKSPKPLWFCWVLALAYFMVSMASGLDGGHAMSASLLLIPWTGYVLSGWQKTSRVKVFRLSPEGLLLLLFLLAGGFYSYLSRWELHGAAEPLYLCSAKMELPVARGIYTSPGQKQELETMVKKIDQLARPGQKILVYAHYHLIYVLARRLSWARGISFSGEMHDVNELKTAAEKALAEKSVVVFQLENGKIFQPLASPKADAIIKNLSGSCTQKIWLQNYLLCPL